VSALLEAMRQWEGLEYDTDQPAEPSLWTRAAINWQRAWHFRFSITAPIRVLLLYTETTPSIASRHIRHRSESPRPAGTRPAHIACLNLFVPLCFRAPRAVSADPGPAWPR
jgi:hypothetical protein